MNSTSPAIVAQSAVRRLPRTALLLLCAAYVLAGFVGRDPLKSSDVTAFGYMLELVAGTSSWWSPTLMGQPLEPVALLPHWLGAWAILWAPAWVDPAFAARIPFMALLWLTFASTWYGVYYLARSPRAQPVAFAFGGEAKPTDYARALADGGLLALIACLGLAQLSHEISAALAQLSFTALTFFGLAALPYRGRLAMAAVAIGLLGLTLSGAPAVASWLGLGGIASCLRKQDADTPEDARQQRRRAIGVALITLAAAALAVVLDLWRWRAALPPAQWTTWRSLGRLLLWFTWP
ncbi:MAG TPA: hypothetical protein VGE47_04035, partial [Burkholderiaceae bacterium]